MQKVWINGVDEPIRIDKETSPLFQEDIAPCLNTEKSK